MIARQTAFQAAITVEQVKELADALGVTEQSLRPLGIGWADGAELEALHAWGSDWTGASRQCGAYSIPEHSGDGDVVGFSFRLNDGRKGAPAREAGCRRGLIIPEGLATMPGAVYVAEGASDVAALLVLGVAGVGRPSNASGAEDLKVLLKGREVIVLGERDQKPDGSWPGREGAEAVAAALGVRLTMPPTGAKDVREWLRQRRSEGLDISDTQSIGDARSSLLNALRENEVGPPARMPGGAPDEADASFPLPQAERLVRLAQETFRIGRTDGGDVFAVRIAGPNLALSLKGSVDALRATLAKAYRHKYGGVVSATALTDALNVLHGDGLDAHPEPVHLRSAPHGDGVVIDLGTLDGRVIVARPGGWEVHSASPVIFRRSGLTSPMPEPERGGRLDEIRSLFNVAQMQWPILLGWMLTSLIPEMDCPVLLFGGEHGTGKSTSAEHVVQLVDPSGAPRRSVPRDADGWACMLAGSQAVLLDNVSSLPQWLSDAICKATTGDGWVKRGLYTDSDLVVMKFRRAIVITSIDPGALRGDLGDRMAFIDCSSIEAVVRVSESQLKADYRRMRPRLFGALLDLLVKVLAVLPTVKPKELPRMADFGRVLAAVDAVLGTDALRTFMAQGTRVASQVVESDRVAEAVMELARGIQATWIGTAGEMLAAITPAGGRLPQGWPQSATAMGGRLRRLAPSLRALGVLVTVPAENDHTRRYSLERTARTAQPPGTDVAADCGHLGGSGGLPHAVSGALSGG